MERSGNDSISISLATIKSQVEKGGLSDEEIVELLTAYIVSSQKALADAGRQGVNGALVASATSGLTDYMTIVGASLALQGFGKEHLKAAVFEAGVASSVEFWRTTSEEPGISGWFRSFAQNRMRGLIEVQQNLPQ
ncbi:hypothetical protein HY024_04855 [Candidatus Curtissbacteria bacterium]|nr:hypothetical protein [Candidatus Curtissbacteria bacterium]